MDRRSMIKKIGSIATVGAIGAGTAQAAPVASTHYASLRDDNQVQFTWNFEDDEVTVETTVRHPTDTNAAYTSTKIVSDLYARANYDEYSMEQHHIHAQTGTIHSPVTETETFNDNRSDDFMKLEVEMERAMWLNGSVDWVPIDSDTIVIEHPQNQA